ncbi:MAG TPA: hypothetical protein VNV66_16440, partial [Pilimelia sp.]|nr:hypothetical protein [Pilimelia sp.]
MTPTAEPPARRATLAKQPAEVAAMFDGVARRYDRTNSVLALGRVRAPTASMPSDRSTPTAYAPVRASSAVE